MGMLFCTSYPRGFIALYELQEEEYYLCLSYVRVLPHLSELNQKGCYLSPIVNGRVSLYLSYFRVILSLSQLHIFVGYCPYLSYSVGDIVPF
jgi:hypothetical protein